MTTRTDGVWAVVAVVESWLITELDVGKSVRVVDARPPLELVVSEMVTVKAVAFVLGLAVEERGSAIDEDELVVAGMFAGTEVACLSFYTRGFHVSNSPPLKQVASVLEMCMLEAAPSAALTIFFSATTTIGTVINRNATTIHAIMSKIDPQHHLSHIFSSADRSRGRAGSLAVLVVGSTYS